MPLDVPASISKHFGIERDQVERVFTYEAREPENGKEPVILEDLDGETSCDELVERDHEKSLRRAESDVKRESETAKTDKRFVQLSIV